MIFAASMTRVMGEIGRLTTVEPVDAAQTIWELRSNCAYEVAFPTPVLEVRAAGDGYYLTGDALKVQIQGRVVRGPRCTRSGNDETPNNALLIITAPLPLEPSP